MRFSVWAQRVRSQVVVPSQCKRQLNALRRGPRDALPRAYGSHRAEVLRDGLTSRARSARDRCKRRIQETRAQSRLNAKKAARPLADVSESALRDD